jgi:N-carbamoyl-L-amino-acid hydrolase
MHPTLPQLNTTSPAQALQWLGGIYEHSPWIAEQALAQRPWRSLAHLQQSMVQVVRQASPAQQRALICAHPELAGKAMVAQQLTQASTHEQTSAGLAHCTPEEFARIQALNAAYTARFGWPFVLAVRGPRGTGLHRRDIIAAMERRLHHHPDAEHAEALRNIHRIAELRLHNLLGYQPKQGHQVWDWCEALAAHSEPEYAAQGQLTATYLSDAHRACAQQIAQWMQHCGFDEVHTDAVGNVVGRYHPAPPHAHAPSLLTGSHYDTVRNGGKYDGRLGILVPMVCVQQLHASGQRLPFGIEVVAFAEEEGQRFAATFLGSSALTGHFDAQWLAQRDANGVTLQAAMQGAGLAWQDIATLQRDPARYLGFVEVHIEQGPVLNALDLPLGVVTSINGSVRYTGEMVGTASHAGTTPMGQRRDAAAAVAELDLYLEARASQSPDCVATMGMLHVPDGSINVVPGRCMFSLDMRAPSDAQRDALEHDILAQAHAIAERRGVQLALQQTVRAGAAPSAPAWQARWEAAVQHLGLPVHRLPSGAGHDAMQMHKLLPQAMLFVRGENGGISHNPLESTTSADMQCACDAFAHLLQQIST